MKISTKLALDYVKPALQEGTIIIMDDFFSYRGDEKKGVAGAFFEFCEKNKDIKFRELFHYGYGGIAYIISNIR